MKCIVCKKEAITTAAHIPVCRKHYFEYVREARAYPKHRPFYDMLRQKEIYEEKNKTYTGC